MSVLVDSSIWVDLLGRAMKYSITPQELETVLTCPPIVQEVLQGISEDNIRGAVKDRFLSLKCVADPIPLELYLKAADLFSTGRRRGLTIRSSIDCLIAAIALQNDLTVWHADRDFEAISKFTSLKTFTKKALR